MFGLATEDSVKDLTDEVILARVQSEPWLGARCIHEDLYKCTSI
jgi:hypothetical protein